MLYLSKIHATKPPRNQQPYEWCDRFLHILNSWNYPRHTEIARNWTGNSAPADPLGRWCLAPAKFIHCRESTMYKYIYISTYTITQATPLKRNVAGPGFDKDDTKIPSGWPPSASAVSSDAPHVEGSHLPSYWSCRSGGGGRMGGWDEWSSQPCFEG